MFRSVILCLSLVVVAVCPALAEPAPEPPKVPRELLEKRRDVVRKIYTQRFARIRGGQGLPSELLPWSERWLEAELALTTRPAERVKALQDHLARTREVERILLAFARAGSALPVDADMATYYRLEAEIRLAREGLKPAKK